MFEQETTNKIVCDGGCGSQFSLGEKLDLSGLVENCFGLAKKGWEYMYKKESYGLFCPDCAKEEG